MGMVSRVVGGWGHWSKMKKKKKINLKRKWWEGITDETNIILIEYLI
jgi:hypothetical protein